ncbi:MAG: hypothetical protein KDA84_14650, partial [Planctomycetaceae bacterium]|nr:hypothetical protein [Planctomycetaceae bacterium]
KSNPDVSQKNRTILRIFRSGFSLFPKSSLANFRLEGRYLSDTISPTGIAITIRHIGKPTVYPSFTVDNESLRRSV